MPVDPAEILSEVNPDELPSEAPPEVSGYREADIQGVACAFCEKFSFAGFDSADSQVPTGVCDQWEAKVGGAMVCDRYASGLPTFDANGDAQWDFADGDRTFNEIHFAATDVSEDQESGFVVKEILRTGEWPVIPTKGGTVNKPLRIVKEGKSSKDDGVIAMEELVENFKASGLKVQIPLSDEESNDHKNTTRLNTGFVRDIWIDGDKLVAKMEFTEPDVKDKVLRGTYADVSCGIPWHMRSRGRDLGSVLEHVCITNRPFIDGLGPFLAASDGEMNPEIVHFGEKIPEEEDSPKLAFSFTEIASAISAQFSQHNLNPSYYTVTDIKGNEATIANSLAEVTFTAPFAVVGEEISLSAPKEWTLNEGEADAPVEQTPTVPRRTESEDSELEAARRLRELRLSDVPVLSTSERGSAVPNLTREELDRLDLSDEQRAAFQQILDENVSLSAQTRIGEADSRVAELEGLGMKDRPGALVLYRQVMLSDDGGPAVVLLSDDGKEKKRLGAKELLDQFIDALKGPDGKVTLSDQAIVSGNDDPPPANSEDEQRPLDERLAEAKAALGRDK